jgi:hypothetical protein
MMVRKWTETCSGVQNEKFRYMNVCYIKIVLTVLYFHLLRPLGSPALQHCYWVKGKVVPAPN